MALTENSVNEICKSNHIEKKEHLELFASDKDDKKNYERKIGFMFFNSDVMLQKIPEKRVLRVSDKMFKNDHSSGDKLKVDFCSFKDLFELGRKNSGNYGANISNFKFKDIDVESMENPSGQTALGPALSIAAGIVSNYGPGSLIVVITDGKANKGIFS